MEAHKDRMIAETRAWRLRERREQFGLTQVELGAATSKPLADTSESSAQPTQMAHAIIANRDGDL